MQFTFNPVFGEKTTLVCVDRFNGLICSEFKEMTVSQYNQYLISESLKPDYVGIVFSCIFGIILTCFVVCFVLLLVKKIYDR